ncbi:UHRF1-binding protein 1-like protein [Heterocephalus glaber]|uniref:UHRF1-binding protein 1-like protein n=1 Tax=Heterocephalus glaber TaxID=10181 RepID=G5BBI0_HETGA|nr:UHRF1-binding protein 1-like protein [Heterocephalus glaber]
MLDLPTWLAINKVFCNKASIRIPWTKLKTHPICLSLDKVIMEMSTCEEPRAPNGPSPIATASGQSEYGFAEKVVEGITVSVNSIVIRIGAKAFNASFELSQLRIYSVNAKWEHGDLRFTRIQDPQRGEVLTFKEINWQMIRIEADATQSSHLEIMCAPVRLITNQSKIRVTLKRRSSTVTPSTQQVKTPQTSNSPDLNDAIVKLFNDFDVKETSHHLVISHLDLHICDDIHAKEKESNRRITGGAMQLSFTYLTIDYYPYHKAGDSCNHWMYFSDATKTKTGWASELLHEFECNVEMLKQAVKDHHVGSPPTSPTHASPQHIQTEKDSAVKGTSRMSAVLPQQSKAKLMSSSVVVRLADFNVYQVSTAEQCHSSPKSMISCNKKSLYLPQEMSAVYVEFTEYYYPDGKDFPIPSPNLYGQLNALQFTVDERSILWLNQFVLDLKQSLNQFMTVYKLNDNSKSDEHVDIRVDGLMLKVAINTSQSESSDLVGRLKRKKLLKEYYSTESEPVANGGQKPSSDPSLSVSSSSLDADIHVLVHVHKHVSMQINHYQYLLLLFLHESLILLADNLRKDVEAVTGNPATQTSVCIGLLLRSAELALLLHPVDQPNPLKSPVSDSVSLMVPEDLPPENGEFLSSKRKQVSSGINQISVGVNHMSDNRSMSVDLSHVPLKDPLLFKSASDTNLQKGTFLDCLSDKHLGKISEDENSGLVYKGGSGAIGSEVNDRKHSSCTDSNHVLNHQEDSSRLSFDNDGNQNILSNSLTNKGNETTESLFKPEDLLLDAASSPDNPEISKEEASAVRTLKSQSSLSGKPKERCPPNLPPLSVSYKNMKRSPSQISLDTISLDSVILEEQLLESDGSDSHVFLEKEIKKDSTNHQSPAESVSTSANLQKYGESSPDAISTNSEGAQENHDDLMSVVVFKITGVNGEIDIRGEDTEICLQVNQVTPDQLGNISLRHYLCNRPVGFDRKSVIHSKSSPEILLRFESGPSAVIHSLLAEKNGFLQCHIENFSTEFLTSSLMNIQHFLEDETVATVMPMKIQVSNTKINLKDDSPRSGTVSLEPTPVTVHIDRLVVERNDDGSFRIRDSHVLNAENHSRENVRSDSALSTSGQCERKKQHGVERATQTSPEALWPAPSVHLPECSSDVSREQLMEENESLKQELAKAKMALAEYHLEKDALLHQIKKMTGE